MWRKEELTEREGDMITHAQQLAKTHRASILVDSQLCHPAGATQLVHRGYFQGSRAVILASYQSDWKLFFFFN